MSKDKWYLSCPHGCHDPEVCPYGRQHLIRIRALLQELAEKEQEIKELKLRHDGEEA